MTERQFKVMMEALQQYIDNSNDIEPTTEEEANKAAAQELLDAMESKFLAATGTEV